MSIYTIIGTSTAQQTVKMFLDTETNRLYDEDDIEIIPHDEYYSNHNETKVIQYQTLDNLNDTDNCELEIQCKDLTQQKVDNIVNHKIPTTLYYNDQDLENQEICNLIFDLSNRLLEATDYENSEIVKIVIELKDDQDPYDLIKYVNHQTKANICTVLTFDESNTDKVQFCKNIIKLGLSNEYYCPIIIKSQYYQVLDCFRYQIIKPMLDTKNKFDNVVCNIINDKEESLNYYYGLALLIIAIIRYTGIIPETIDSVKVPLPDFKSIIQ